MSESSPTREIKSPFRKNVIVLCLLIIAHAGLGVFFHLFYDLDRSVFAFEPLENPPEVMMSIGFLLSQPILLAFWAAFTPRKFINGFLLTLTICITVSFIEDFVRLSRPPYGPVIFLLFDVLLFFSTIPFLLPFRCFLHWRIGNYRQRDEASDYSFQFGLIHLFLLTTIIALGFGLFRTLIVLNHLYTFYPLKDYVLLIVSIVGAIFPAILIGWLVLASWKKPRRPMFIAIILLGSISVLMGLAALDLIEYRSAYIPLFSNFGCILYFQAGAALSVFFTTLVIRLLNYRIKQTHVESKTMTPQSEDPFGA